MEYALSEFVDPYDDELVDSRDTKISEIVPPTGKHFRFTYTYDFGDEWEHEVIFEGCLPADKSKRYPRCVDGARACPPEDIGGIYGYAEFLEARTDPDADVEEEYREWAQSFDPEEFSAAAASGRMRVPALDWDDVE